MNSPPTAKRVSRLSDEVAVQLERWMTEQQLSSGTQLPTEKALCERFGVSRAVIREALSRLKAEGCVTTRQGSGAFVAARPGQGSFRLMRDAEHAGDTATREMAHMFELRFLVETGAAERAALRRTAEDLERMRAVLARMQDALVWQADAVGDDDAFHIVIAAATHNPQIERFQAFMGGQFSDSRAPTWSRDGHRSGRARQAQAEHMRIFEAISRGDAGAARRAAEEHLVSAARRLGLDRLRWGGDRTEGTR